MDITTEIEPLARRSWRFRPEFTTLEKMGVRYNPATQRNELDSVAIVNLPQFLTGSDHTSTNNNDEDDYTSDV